MDLNRGMRFFPGDRTGILLFCLGVALHLAVALFFYLNLYPDIQRLMPDDTLYYLKIAENIAQGHGSVFSPGEPTNGYHPLWMGILSIVRFLFRPGREPFILVSLLMSVLLNGTTALLLRRFLLRLGFTGSQQTLGMSLYLFLPWLVLLNLSGLETPLFFMCLVLFFIMLQGVISSDGPQLRGHVLLGIAAGFLFLARTDSVFFILCGAAVVLWKRKSWAEVRNLAMTGLVTALVSLPWLFWCWNRFGSPVQSSGMALSYFRWHTMFPVSTLKYWLYNGGRLFHKLAVIFLSPFVYHARNFDTIIPLWCDLAMFAAAAATVYFVVRNRHRIILPAYIWLPALLLLVFYTFVRIASAVWHMSIFPLILLLLLVNLSRGVRWRTSSVTAALVCLLILNLYTLGNGFYYPQQATDMMGSAMETGWDSPDSLLIGATDSGYLGYFISDRHVVVNLDGVVNQRAFTHIREGTFGDYLEELDPDILRISPEMLEFYCRNSGR
ncbi:MAG: hypothetical protein JXA64_07345 [Candidatus Fermentibacteraceae bacterium]|nr:hypothetical protein [Candidatus Fermentibacteraceae bacterium]MBN2608915.1 hypothetical protein [Candidatus Fermentibacteraceae bacterium]